MLETCGRERQKFLKVTFSRSCASKSAWVLINEASTRTATQSSTQQVSILKQ